MKGTSKLGCYVLPFQGASVNYALIIKVRGKPMRKIRHGFIALAILGGPASLILTHQNLTETLPQDASHPSDVAAIVQQAYSRCSEAPRAVRPSHCEDYIRSFDECAARKNGCNPHSVYEVLLKLSFTPSDQGVESSPKSL
jgi:hypothetical protein